MNNPGRRKEHGPAAAGHEHEQALVQRIGARDRHALEELYVLYHRRLARFLTRFIREYELAQEIINDTLFIVWQRAEQFRGDSRVSTWIMGIAYRRALKALRHASARLPAAPRGERAEAAAFDDLARTEQQELFERALAALPLEQRLVLELTYYLGHSGEEVAAILECPLSTVKTRMFYARRKLRDLLPALGGERME